MHSERQYGTIECKWHKNDVIVRPDTKEDGVDTVLSAQPAGLSLGFLTGINYR